jgi:hypothetical protein
MMAKAQPFIKSQDPVVRKEGASQPAVLNAIESRSLQLR